MVVAHALDVRARVDTGLGPPELPARWVFDGLNPRPWQLVTYAFVHANRSHLATNVLALSVACALTEWRVGATKTLASVLALSAAVALGFHAMDGRDLYGASGVAAAMVTLCAVLWWGAREKSAGVRALVSACGAGYFAWTEALPWIAGRANPGWKAHAVGALCGAVLGVALLLGPRGRGRSLANA
jgi:membrane associated rhomboid family serine protease